MKPPKKTFLIYGAASEVVAPLYTRYVGAEFIGIVNTTPPPDACSVTLSSGDPSLSANLEAALAAADADSLLIYINAAVYQVDKLFGSMSTEEIDRMISVGILQQLQVAQLFLKEAVKRRQGRLINLSSFRAKSPAAGTSVYSAIKSFTNTFFKSVSIEYGRLDITANNILMGFVETRLLRQLGGEKVESLRRRVVKKKFLPTGELYDLIDLIINSSYMNGAEIELDGQLIYLD